MERVVIGVNTIVIQFLVTRLGLEGCFNNVEPDETVLVYSLSLCVTQWTCTLYVAIAVNDPSA